MWLPEQAAWSWQATWGPKFGSWWVIPNSHRGSRLSFPGKLGFQCFQKFIHNLKFIHNFVCKGGCLGRTLGDLLSQPGMLRGVDLQQSYLHYLSLTQSCEEQDFVLSP